MEEIKKKTFTSVEEIMNNGINRDNAVVREWDKVYCNLAKEILDKGEPYVSRAGEVAGSLFAKITGYEPGELSWRIDDAHIYKNQLEGMKLQLERFSKMRYIEELIKDSTDTEVIALYKRLLDEYENIDVNHKGFKNLEEYLTMFELMITKPKAELYVAKKDSIYEYDNQKNNKDIYVKNYKPAPIIRFPVSK